MNGNSNIDRWVILWLTRYEGMAIAKLWLASQ